MFAVIRTGGKQYKVSKNDTLRVEKLSAGAGETVTIGDVLLVCDGAKSTVGVPTVAGAKVMAEIVEHVRADKIIVFKKKRRQNYRRKNGHRQDLTLIKITDIKAA
ncbi:MAG: 50S ribosomal protein L21 [Rhodospirillales bacterium]|nr:50S ribosomal protein L21 [Rhodospirillales bacterium]